MYTQQYNVNKHQQNASFKEYPNRIAIQQMQKIQENEKSINKNNFIQNNSSYLDKLIPALLFLLLSQDKIDNDEICYLIIAGILTL